MYSVIISYELVNGQKGVLTTSLDRMDTSLAHSTCYSILRESFRGMAGRASYKVIDPKTQTTRYASMILAW